MSETTNVEQLLAEGAEHLQIDELWRTVGVCGKYQIIQITVLVLYTFTAVIPTLSYYFLGFFNREKMLLKLFLEDIKWAEALQEVHSKSAKLHELAEIESVETREKTNEGTDYIQSGCVSDNNSNINDPRYDVEVKKSGVESTSTCIFDSEPPQDLCDGDIIMNTKAAELHELADGESMGTEQETNEGSDYIQSGSVSDNNSNINDLHYEVEVKKSGDESTRTYDSEPPEDFCEKDIIINIKAADLELHELAEIESVETGQKTNECYECMQSESVSGNNSNINDPHYEVEVEKFGDESTCIYVSEPPQDLCDGDLMIMMSPSHKS